MALIDLPCELLDLIIEYSVPESLESLATTCKILQDRCIPFMDSYNKRRSRFRHFGYYFHPYDDLVAASDLISLIASDPSIARYIRTASLLEDSKFLKHIRTRGMPPKSVPSIEEGGAIVQLFARSPYLRRAGLDWKEYYATFAEDVREMRYSQHGSVFLLTLLPHVEWLKIPGLWKPNTVTNSLLEVLAKDAQQTPSTSSGLWSAKTLIGKLWGTETENWGLSWMNAFFALPNLAAFSICDSFAVAGSPDSLPLTLGSSPADALVTAHFNGCCIDDVGIGAFLKHTPNLNILSYAHSTKDERLPPNWDICKFINAIAREAGPHLTELSVRIHDLRGSILPGRVSARSFQRLQKFEFPSKLLMCNVKSASVIGNIATSFQYMLQGGSFDPFVQDLVPSSLAHLWIRSDGKGPYDAGLYTLFRHFRSIRKAQLPHLEHVYVDCKQEADNAYKQQCNTLVKEGEKENLVVHLNTMGSSGGIEWGSSPVTILERPRF